MIGGDGTAVTKTSGGRFRADHPAAVNPRRLTAAPLSIPVPRERGAVAQANANVTRLAVAAAFLLGVAARFVLPQQGFNYDVTSFRIVGDIVASGGNVYAETERYNYGPVWFLILGALRIAASATGDPERLFRLGIVAVLTLADLAIAAMLNRRIGPRAAILFFLNPVSIVITGYHNQFDNVAIAAGLAGALLAERAAKEGGWRLTSGALALFGLSLATKHLFFVLPLWLAFRARSWREALVAAGVPILLFVASFLPFAPGGWRGIVHNVLLYRSFGNGPAARILHEAGAAIPPSLLLVAGLAAAGWLLRRRPLFESVLVYLVLLVVLSPAMANQYLAIPMASVAAALNPAYALYALSSFLILLSNSDGLASGLLTWLGAPGLDTRTGYDLPVALLAAGLSWQLLGWRRSARQGRPQPGGLRG
jgi:hypothetical protein